MKLLVVSHKPCWSSDRSPSGYATDGGFPFQMRAIAELFDATTVMVPCSAPGNREGEVPLEGPGLTILPVTMPAGVDLRRKLAMPAWIIRHALVLLREIARADAVHTPIPGDIGTLGMIAAFISRKPLCVRYCGNWFVQQTLAERLLKRFMERVGGGRNVMFATGGADSPPSRNAATRWIFATTLRADELTDSGPRDAPTGGRARLIIVCRQEQGKGTDTLIESLTGVARTHPAVHLDVVGGGRELPALRRLAARLDVAGRVTFHGSVNHDTVLSLLKQADLFCYPTHSEGFPKVVLEALACGLPVVTTPVSVLPHLIGQGGGVLVNTPGAPALTEAIVGCLSDAPRYRAMSERAIATARQYSLEQWRDQIGDVLRAAWGPLTTTSA
jgi:glycosyltransferase involved in cell wall biosynthesis